MCLNNDLKEHFTIISQQRQFCSSLFLIDLPPFYNKAGEFYTLLFQNFSQTYFDQLCNEIDSTDFEPLKLTLLYEFYQEAESLFSYYATHSLSTKDEQFIHQVVMLSLFNLYNEVILRFPNLHPNNKLTINELLYLISCDFNSKKNEEGTLEHNISQYLDLRVDSTQANRVSDDLPSYIKSNVLDKEIRTPKDLGLLNIAETEELIGLKATAIYNLVKKGSIQKTKVGKNNMYQKQSIIDYIKRKNE